MLFGSRQHSSWHDAAAAGGRRVCLCLCQAALKSGVSAHESDAAASDSARLDPASSQSLAGFKKSPGRRHLQQPLASKAGA